MSDRHDPDVGSFLLLLAARRSPRTVDAYRRDLASFGATIDHAVGAATAEEIEAWLAGMRADGRAPATIARRLAAVRAYLRHLTLIGTRADNPAAAIAGPRRALDASPTPAHGPPVPREARLRARRDLPDQRGRGPPEPQPLAEA